MNLVGMIIFRFLIKLADIYRLFDNLNSIPRGKGFRSPLYWSSFEKTRQFFIKCHTYLMGLKMRETRLVNCELRTIETLLYKSKRKTAVVGLITTMRSIIAIMDSELSRSDSSLKYLPTFKISQDILENFFGLLRSRFGFNNNPNALQLMQAIKGIICMKTEAITTGNCIEQEDLSTRICPLGNFATIISEEETPHDLEPEEADDDEEELSSLSCFSSNVVLYISGFVGRKLSKKIQCPSCAYKLYATESCVPLISSASRLLQLKDNGGLFLPSYGLYSICKLSEQIIRARKDLSKLKLRDLENCVFAELIKLGNTNPFESGCIVDKDIAEDHSKEAIKAVVSAYWQTRSGQLAKQATFELKSTTNRQKLSKVILFSGN